MYGSVTAAGRARLSSARRRMAQIAARHAEYRYTEVCHFREDFSNGFSTVRLADRLRREAFGCDYAVLRTDGPTRHDLTDYPAMRLAACACSLMCYSTPMAMAPISLRLDK